MALQVINLDQFHNGEGVGAPYMAELQKIKDMFAELYGMSAGTFPLGIVVAAPTNVAATDTAAIQTALDTAGAMNPVPPVYTRTGTYRVNPLGIYKIGAGLIGSENVYGTTFAFVPLGNQSDTPGNNAPDPGTCIEMCRDAGENILYNAYVKNIRITCTDTSFTKNAFRIVEGSEVRLDNIRCEGFFGGDSVGVRDMGHELCKMRRYTLYACVPYRVSRSPKTYSGVAYSGDHRSCEDGYLIAAHAGDAATKFPATLPSTCVLIDDAVFISNFVMEGQQAWVGGQYGLFWNMPGNSNSIIYNISIKNVRKEQSHSGAQNPNGDDGRKRWFAYINHTGATNLIRTIAFENCYGSGTSTDGGYFFRRVQQATFKDCHHPCNSLTGETPLVFDFVDVYQISVNGLYTDTNSRISMGSNVGALNRNSAVFRQNYPIPFVGAWGFGSGKAARTDTGRIVDWDFTDLQSCDTIEWNGAGPIIVASIMPPLFPFEKELTIRNRTTDYPMILEHNQGTSTTAAAKLWNIDLGVMILMPGDEITFRYSLTFSNWRVKSWPSKGERYGLSLFEDFVGGYQRLGNNNAAGGSALNGTIGVDATSKFLGSVSLTTSTGTTGGASIGNTVAAAIVPTLGPALYLARLILPAAPDGTETYSVVHGLVDSVTANDGAAYEARWTGAIAEWSLSRYANSATPTRNTSNIPIGTTAIIQGIFMNAAWTAATYFYSTDGVTFQIDAVATTGLPSNAQYAGFGAKILKSAGTTARTLGIDYIGYRMDYAR